MSGNRKMNVALGKNNKYGVDGIKSITLKITKVSRKKRQAVISRRIQNTTITVNGNHAT